MKQIDREGVFRAYPISSGFGLSSGGFPQWSADFQAVEYYDEDEQIWVDWSQYEECEISGYFVIAGEDTKKTFKNAPQLQKSLGWSGVNFQDLNADFSETLVQITVKEDTYEGKTKLKVTWINHADAEPGRIITKLDKDEVQKVNAKYAAALKKLSGGPKPKTVPAKPATSKPEVPKPKVDKEAAKAALKAKTAEKAERGKKAEEKATKKTPPAKPQTLKPKEECTLDQAWETVYAAKGDMSDDDLGNVWLQVIDKYGDQDTLTGEEWVAVRDEVIKEIS